MPTTKKQFIQELNKDLEWEYAATVQYIQHAAVITGPQYDTIAKELIVHANEELAHAVKLSVVISDLGGSPTVEIEKRKKSPAAKGMLAQDLAGEELAIWRYKERIRQSEELAEFGVKRILEDILMQEEEHRRDLLNSLGR